MSDEINLDDESSKLDKKPNDSVLKKELESTSKKKYTQEQLDDKIQSAKNEVAKELASRNSELNNKIIELKSKLDKAYEDLGVTQQSLSQMDEEYNKLKNNKQSLSQDELLNLLYETSLNDRQKIILTKYQKEMKSFQDQLGTKSFNEALGMFMVDKIEQKLMAMKENKPNV